MDLGLKGKTALVLAASKGLGRASAEALAAEGCNLAICARDPAALSRTAETLEQQYKVSVIYRPGDVTSATDRRVFLEVATRVFGKVDILINNCGGPRPGSLRDLQEEDWLEAVRRSLLQVVDWTRETLPYMRRGGRIVNIVSISVKQPVDGLLLSNSIRPGVIGFAKTISRELMGQGITINSVLPGTIRTDRLLELARERAEREQITPDEALAERAREVPAGRLGEPSEVGALVAFLCSEQAGYITGTTVTIDGGLTRTIF